MCLLGDGTTNIGAFHESLNLAGLWNLPIVYVIMNNKLGMGTPVALAAAEPDLYKRGCSYRIEGERVELREGHAVFVPAGAEHRFSGYEELSVLARSADPVPLFRERLIEAGVFDSAQADEIDAATEQRVTEAVAFADDSPDPSVENLFDYTYATAVANASTALPGDPVVVLS